MVYVFHGIRLNLRYSVIWDILDDIMLSENSQEEYTTNTVGSHLFVESPNGELTETEGRAVIAKALAGSGQSSMFTRTNKFQGSNTM